MKSFESCYYDFLVGEDIATEEEINLVTSINGWSVDTMDDILYARTGNRSIDQYADENYVDLSDYGIEWSNDEDEDEDEVSGVGSVDNNWGANEMYLSVMNKEPLYRRFRRNCFVGFDQKEVKVNTIAWIERMLFSAIQSGQITFNPGMGKGQTARMLAANEIYNSFKEDWNTADNEEKSYVIYSR